MRARLCAAFFDFLPFRRRELRYFVLPALDLSEYKRFDGSIYRNMRALFLFISVVCWEC